MKLKKTELDDCYLLEKRKIKDGYNFSVKVYDSRILEKNNLHSNFIEGMYTVSNKDVISGMHYEDKYKIIYVNSGSILQVVLCVNKSSVDYGKTFSIVLSNENKLGLYVGKGNVCGFKCLEDNTIINYLFLPKYSFTNDNGCLWNSFGFDWQVENPLVSDKDSLLPKFKLKKIGAIKNADWKKFKR
jgi:dTDP-4-dehydrorhamnose 3,5-epimerase/CDP-3, 6-dideoxy-D-glycero-D-glycero-4-hexulose-5-epimerase